MGRVILNSEKTHRSFVSVVIFEAKKRCLPSGPNNSNYLEFMVDFDLRFDAKFKNDNEVIRSRKPVVAGNEQLSALFLTI